MRATSVPDPGAFAEASVTVSSGPDIIVLNANRGQFDFDMGEPATFSINRSLYGGFAPPNSNHFVAGSPGIGFVTGTSIANPARTKEFIIINRGTTTKLASNPALRNFETWDFDVRPGAVGGTILVTLSRPANDSHPAFTKTFTATFTHPRTPLPTVTLHGYTLDLFFEQKGMLGTGINTQPGGPGQVWTWGL